MRNKNILKRILVTGFCAAFISASASSLSVHAAEEKYDPTTDTYYTVNADGETVVIDKEAEADVTTTTNSATATTDTKNTENTEGEKESEEEKLDVAPYIEKIDEEGDRFRVNGEIPESSVTEAMDAVEKLAVEFKAEGVVKEIIERDKSVLIKFADGTEYTWYAGDVNNGTQAEEKKDKSVTLQPAQETPQTSSEETTRWTPVDSKNKTQTFRIAVPSASVRYEIFYTAGSQLPYITFRSTTAKEDELLVAGTDVLEEGEDGFKFVTKTGLTIEGHDEFRYMVIYIDNTKDPGMWTMNVTVPEEMTETIAVSSQVPEDWENLVADKLTKPYGVIFWYVDAQKSRFRDTPIATINQLISAKSGNASVDSLQTTKEDEIDYTPIYIFIVALVLIGLMGLLVFMIIKTKKKNDAAYLAKREAIVEKENEKVRKRKSSENDELDEMLDSYSDEYIDDDMDDYMKVDDSQESDPDLFTEDHDDNGFYENSSSADRYMASQRIKNKMSDSPSRGNVYDEEQKETVPAFLQNDPVSVQPPKTNNSAPAQTAPASGAPAWLNDATDDDDDNMFF